MKTIHESLTEILETIQLIKDMGVDITIMYKPQELLDVPDEVTESLAKAYLPRIAEFYKNEDNLKAYEQWKKEQDSNKKGIA